jgi:hypothetical protein
VRAALRGQCRPGACLQPRPLAREADSVYNLCRCNVSQTYGKESSMKLILAAILAGTFLVALPVKAADKADDSSKADKPAKESKKTKSDKSATKEEKKDDKPAGGGW